MPDNCIDMIAIPDLFNKKFFIPDFQRGYRWEAQQVTDLLADIWEFADKKPNGFYCLQPIVVKKCTASMKQENNLDVDSDWYEVIDGQQRLTTIRILLYFYYHDICGDDPYEGKKLFTIQYQTRPGSAEFLSSAIAKGIDTGDVDRFHMSTAYDTMIKWFNGEGKKEYESRPEKRTWKFWSVIMAEKGKDKSIQFIWYEINEATKSEDLFERLNKGKIPLTNAELIKAMFLNSSSFADCDESTRISHQSEIAKQWDIMEHRLNDEKFWSFVSNAPIDSYATKIEFLFENIDLEIENPEDRLATYLKFNAAYSSGRSALWSLWEKVEDCYLALNYWYENKDLYHKIGFLIAEKEKISELVSLMQNSTKQEFFDEVDEKIRKKIADDDIASLRYDVPGEKKKLQTLLFFYNVETSRLCQNPYDFYPFMQHKEKGWTLEHIHAQQSEGFNENDKSAWLAWLHDHGKVLDDLATKYDENSDIYKRLKSITNEIRSYLQPGGKELNFSLFRGIVDNVLAVCKIITNEAPDGASQPPALHELSNMALLGGIENTKLTNSIFEVKRREIIKMDREGDFIPICTRRVFLKYYSNESGNETQDEVVHYFFWSSKDRKKYLADIIRVLGPYLPSIKKLNNGKEVSA